ncbi:SUR7/PalI family domain-containing protein [Purpureocillium lilacinum]|uniref:SUR7/PalI family domain-containing protein n=1 Tax=Purpureocillium lilacinum TaxID=33203 RepID=A0A179HM74_PURLI|nr:SUR7/PalI family domain-containing protein [Purpureocillium lilacinum]OAQ91407.1 SUR7/PalI family domain-containing protein [Purpureocillium lilacinum]
MAQGIGRLALAGVPYILSLITIIIIILIFVAGNKPGALEDLALLKVHVGSLTIPSKLSSSQFLQDLQKISGADLTGSSATAQSLGLASLYSVHVYTTCAYFIAETTCSSFKVGSWFNAATALKLDTTVVSINLSDDFNHSFDTYKKAAYFMGVGFILAFVFLVLAAVLSGLGSRFRTLAVSAAALSWIATGLLLSDAVVTLVTARRTAGAVTSELGSLGITAELGKVVYLPFFAFALSLITSILYTLEIRRTRTNGLGPAAKKRALMVGAASFSDSKGEAEAAAGAGNGPISSAKPGILQRVTTWTRHRYVQVERQPAVARAPDNDDGGMASRTNALRGQRDFDYDNPAEEGDIAMVSLGGRGESGNNHGPRDVAYEPYSTQLPPTLSLSHEPYLHQFSDDGHGDTLHHSSRITDVREQGNDRPLITHPGV